jgi:hypothetical protein
MHVYREIALLVRTATNILFVDGYMTPVGMDPIFDDSGEESVTHIIGCTVRAKNDDNVLAYEDVYYPESWLDRENAR